MWLGRYFQSLDMNSSNIEPELNSLHSKLQVEIERDSKEIETLKKRIEKNEALLRAVKNSLSIRQPAEYGSKSEIIREAINRYPKAQFTQADIEEEIKRSAQGAEINRARVRAHLWGMAGRGKIKVVRKGTNKEPALYEKSESNNHSKRPPDQSKPQTIKDLIPRTTPITAHELEETVRWKTGRINDISVRLGTTSQQILSLLEPASTVYVADRGWLKVRE
jgi:hypothetical protein